MSKLIEAGLTITLIGMSTVFVLLGVLVWIVQLMARLDPHGGDAAGGSRPVGDQSVDDAELISVIGAAVRTFRSRHAGGRKPE